MIPIDHFCTIDFRLTSDLPRALLSLLKASESDQILITSSRGKQLEQLRDEVQKAIRHGDLPGHEVMVTLRNRR